MLKTPRQKAAFTLVELMVSAAIIGLLGLILVQITGQTAKTWKVTSGKVEQFRESRTAFDTMTTRIAQATLNTYWDYDNPTAPTRYERRSELRFLMGSAETGDTSLGDYQGAKRITHCAFFHAPLGFVDDAKSGNQLTNYHGLESLLNVWGYFVEYNDDANLRPPVLNSVTPKLVPRNRFRLMEMMVPAERMDTYKFTSGMSGTNILAETYKAKDWYLKIVNSTVPYTHVLAENVVALILRPQLSAQDRVDLRNNSIPNAEIAPNYVYDTTLGNSNRFTNTKNQLPPVVQVTMVAIDETSAARLHLEANSENIFEVKSKFRTASKFKQDLAVDPQGAEGASLENKLIALKANYRIFSSTVQIRAAKWSQEQSN